MDGVGDAPAVCPNSASRIALEPFKGGPEHPCTKMRQPSIEKREGSSWTYYTGPPPSCVLSTGHIPPKEERPEPQEHHRGQGHGKEAPQHELRSRITRSTPLWRASPTPFSFPRVSLRIGPPIAPGPFTHIARGEGHLGPVVSQTGVAQSSVGDHGRGISQPARERGTRPRFREP